MVQYVLFAMMLVLIAILLRFIFSFGEYRPAFYEPKDFEREKQLKK